jgi:hypothetical protein
MIRGEFHRGDGLVIPNNVTTAGALAILDRAFRNPSGFLWLGLCRAVPTQTLTLADCEEPTIGEGGYERVLLERNVTDWPTLQLLNYEPYIESKSITFEATDDGFDAEIQRLMLVFSEEAVTGDVFALSAPLPELLTITTSTPVALRTFKYRIYLR